MCGKHQKLEVLEVLEVLEPAIGGKNSTDVNFAIIRNQVRFIDTVKYFPQSLGSLADSMTDIERKNVRKICRKFLAEKLMLLNDEDEKWVLDYLASGKGMIPYQMITTFDSLNICPETDFFKHEDFYSSLKEKNISEEQRSTLLQKLFKYNAKKCNSASSFSGCVHRLKSKCCIALPTDAEIIRVFDQNLDIRI